MNEHDLPVHDLAASSSRAQEHGCVCVIVRCQSLSHNSLHTTFLDNGMSPRGKCLHFREVKKEASSLKHFLNFTHFVNF